MAARAAHCRAASATPPHAAHTLTWPTSDIAVASVCWESEADLLFFGADCMDMHKSTNTTCTTKEQTMAFVLDPSPRKASRLSNSRLSGIGIKVRCRCAPQKWPTPTCTCTCTVRRALLPPQQSTQFPLMRVSCQKKGLSVHNVDRRPRARRSLHGAKFDRCVFSFLFLLD